MSDIKQAELRFPVECELRVIYDKDAADVPAAAEAVLRRRGMSETWTAGRASAGGRYLTLGVKVTMPDRAALEAIPAELARIPGVRMVL